RVILRDPLEPRLRRLVADSLGVGPDELAPDVSLTDDLAADSLDLAELAARLEVELGLVVSDRVVVQLHTYGDLVRAALTAAREGPGNRAAAAGEAAAAGFPEPPPTPGDATLEAAAAGPPRAFCPAPVRRPGSPRRGTPLA